MTRFYGPVFLKIKGVKGSVAKPTSVAGSIAATYLDWPSLDPKLNLKVVGGGSTPWKAEHAQAVFNEFKERRSLDLEFEPAEYQPDLWAAHTNAREFERADVFIALSAKLMVQAVLEGIIVSKYKLGSSSFKERPVEEITLQAQRGKVVRA